MKLPNAEEAVVAEDKIRSYLLSLSHSLGRGKANYFLSLGFRAETWQTTAQALRHLAQTNDVVKTESTEFGQRYVIDGAIRSSDGRNPVIRTVWFIEQRTDQPYFVTAYPQRKR